MSGKIISHEGHPEHLIRPRQKDGEWELFYVRKSDRVEVQWRPDPKGFRLEQVTGVVDGVRYVSPRGTLPMKLLDIRVGKGMACIDESTITGIAPAGGRGSF